jgi:hypothetical protein
MSARGPKPGEPYLREMAARRMAVVRTTGDPNVLMPRVMPALYKAVYKLRAALKAEGRAFTVEPLWARWPVDITTPQDQWTDIWGLSVPDGTDTVPQVVPDFAVTVETWAYGTIAEVEHRGPYATEGPTVARLHAFIESLGDEIVGLHEEEYRTRPGAPVQRALIRYPVRSPESRVAVRRSFNPSPHSNSTLDTGLWTPRLWTLARPTPKGAIRRRHGGR